MTDIKCLEITERVYESLYPEGYCIFILLWISNYNPCFFYRDLPKPAKANDYLEVGKDIREKLHKLAGKYVVPAIMNYLELKKYSTIDGIPVHYYPFKKLVFYHRPLSGAFNPDQRYDLYKMLPLVDPGLQRAYVCIMLGQEAVGAAIRICKVIGRLDFADQFNKIVEGCFVPDEEAKELGPIKKSDFLGMWGLLSSLLKREINNWWKTQFFASNMIFFFYKSNTYFIIGYQHHAFTVLVGSQLDYREEISNTEHTI